MAFCAAGETHGMRNVGSRPPSYPVIEFDSAARGSLSAKLREVVPAHRRRRKPGEPA